MDVKKKILIVDDEQINLEFFEVMLTKLNFQVEKAENGLEALDAIKRHRPDLVILDNMMPKLSGWEVTKILKTKDEYREYSDIPIIMFSAMDDVKDKVAGFELGIDDYITKPYNFSEVLARIRAVLRGRELIHQLEKRDSRINLIEGMNKDLINFAEKSKELFHRFIDASKNPGDSEAFRNKVAEDCTKALENEKKLDNEIRTLREEEAILRREEITLKSLKSPTYIDSAR
jgi:DNA-binding response OmpR family regulator